MRAAQCTPAHGCAVIQCACARRTQLPLPRRFCICVWGGCNLNKLDLSIKAELHACRQERNLHRQLAQPMKRVLIAQVSRGIWVWKRLFCCNGFPISTIAILLLEPQVWVQLTCLCYGFQRCAGAAQNNGGMASNKLVVSKDTGFGMLAKSLSDTLGYPIDKKQAQNKFSYLERKFHIAKTWHRTSGVGITDDDRACGLSCAFLLHVKGNYLIHSNRNI